MNYLKMRNVIFGKTMCLFLSCMIGFLSANGQQETLTDTPVQIKYLGGDNESLQFNVKYENKSASSFKLLALNESGEIWFQENYRNTAKEFDKKLSIPRLTETEYIVFLLRTANQPEISLRVKVTTKVVDEVVDVSK